MSVTDRPAADAQGAAVAVALEVCSGFVCSSQAACPKKSETPGPVGETLADTNSQPHAASPSKSQGCYISS